MSDLPARLRANAECGVITAPKELLIAAADRIEALAAEVERLRESEAELQHGVSDFVEETNYHREKRNTAERALTDYTRHEQTLRDNGIPSHSHAVVMICDLRRALAEAVKVIGFYADEGNWRSLSKGFALQYDPEPSAFQKDRGAAARDFITAQEKEKGK